MAKKKKRRKRSFTIPIALVAGIGAGLARPIQIIMEPEHNITWALNELSKSYTGVDFLTNVWNPADMSRGLLPIVIGGLVHKFVGGSLGVNRALGAAGVPVIRV